MPNPFPIPLPRNAKTWFLVLFALVAAIKLIIIANLPTFVDEAFYWLEGQHMAPAYSDLPGLAAWMTRAGVELLGNNQIGLRAPFFLLSLLIPLLVWRITKREFNENSAWIAASFALLMPLAGTLGVMALPDVPLTVATLLCVDAGSKLCKAENASVELAIGLILGALTHYRFAAVIAVGFVAMLAVRQGRQALKDWRVWLAILAGALAWLPLLIWNLQHGDAGIRFQLVDRHPWTFHADGLRFIPVQAIVTTPILFFALIWLAWTHRNTHRYIALSGGLLVLVYFVLGFFADSTRISFHWPLAGYLALLAFVPSWLQRIKPIWQKATWSLTSLGLVLALLYLAGVALPNVHQQLLGSRMQNKNFVDWLQVNQWVDDELRRQPAQLVAGDFKVGAELGFVRSDANIRVLPHTLNDRHGRTAQLAQWRLLVQESPTSCQPTLIVVDGSETDKAQKGGEIGRLQRYLGPVRLEKVLDLGPDAPRYEMYRTQPCDGPAKL